MELLGKQTHTELADRLNTDSSKSCRKQPPSCMHKPGACAVLCPAPCMRLGYCLQTGSELPQGKGSQQRSAATSDLWSRHSKGLSVPQKSSSVCILPPCNSISQDWPMFAVHKWHKDLENSDKLPVSESRGKPPKKISLVHRRTLILHAASVFLQGIVKEIETKIILPDCPIGIANYCTTTQIPWLMSCSTILVSSSTTSKIQCRPYVWMNGEIISAVVLTLGS